MGVMLGRVERAVLSVGEIGKVHIGRWGEGAEHLHWWFIGRPAGLGPAAQLVRRDLGRGPPAHAAGRLGRQPRAGRGGDGAGLSPVARRLAAR